MLWEAHGEGHQHSRRPDVLRGIGYYQTTQTHLIIALK